MPRISMVLLTGLTGVLLGCGGGGSASRDGGADGTDAGPLAQVCGVAELYGLTERSGTTVTLLPAGTSATTDAEGKFCLGAPSGAYQLDFENGVYHRFISGVVVQAGGSSRVTVPEGESSVPLDSIVVTLLRGRQVSDTTPWLLAWKDRTALVQLPAPEGGFAVKVLNVADGSSRDVAHFDRAVTFADSDWSQTALVLEEDITDSRLYAVSLSTSGATELARGVTFAAVGADGVHVVYATASPAGVTWTSIKGQGKTVLTAGETTLPALSASRKYLLYNEGAPGTGGPLKLVTLATGELTDLGSYQVRAQSSDGTLVAVSSTARGTGPFKLLALDAPASAATIEPMGIVAAAQFTPDGRYLLYRLDDLVASTSVRTLRAYPVAGGAVVPLGQRGDGPYRFIEGGRKLWLLGGNAGELTVQTVAIPSGEVTSFGPGQLPDAPTNLEGAVFPFISAGGLMLASGSTGQSSVLAADASPDMRAVQVSPDETRVVFGHTCASSACELAVIGLDGAPRTELGIGRAPRFSPDGARLAFNTATGKAASLVVAAVTGGAKVVLGPAGDDMSTFGIAPTWLDATHLLADFAGFGGWVLEAP